MLHYSNMRSNFFLDAFHEYQKVILKCKPMKGNKILSVVKFYYYKLKGKHLLVHPNTIISGIKNISTTGILSIGIDYFGFISKRDFTYLNICGKLITKGVFSIGRGCRFDIGSDAICILNKNSYISPFTNFIIMHGISIGEDCAISWNCQFLDEDFHSIEYPNKKNSEEKKIVISDKVWIGCNVNVFKGTVIAKGCVIAANSVVSGLFIEENCLIAGNPATVIKKNINWN